MILIILDILDVDRSNLKMFFFFQHVPVVNSPFRGSSCSRQGTPTLRVAWAIWMMAVEVGDTMKSCSLPLLIDLTPPTIVDVGDGENARGMGLPSGKLT